jgi:hypothetical protein
MLASAAGVDAQTKSVRVIAAGAAVLREPDPKSATIITIPLGTVMEVAAERAGWYEVWLPAVADRPRSRGFIAASLVEPFAPTGRAASDSTLRGASSSPGSGAAVPDAEWQGRYDRAVGRKRAGTVKTWIGGPAALAGGVLVWYYFIKMAVADTEEERRRYLEIPRLAPAYGLAGGGAALLIWGQRQVGRANADLLLLEVERGAVQPGGAFSQSMPPVRETRGRPVVAPAGMSVAVRVSW